MQPAAELAVAVAVPRHSWVLLILLALACNCLLLAAAACCCCAHRPCTAAADNMACFLRFTSRARAAPRLTVVLLKLQATARRTLLHTLCMHPNPRCTNAQPSAPTAGATAGPAGLVTHHYAQHKHCLVLNQRYPAGTCCWPTSPPLSRCFSPALVIHHCAQHNHSLIPVIACWQLVLLGVNRAAGQVLWGQRLVFLACVLQGQGVCNCQVCC